MIEAISVRHVEHVMGTAVSFDIRPGRQEVSEVRLALARARAALIRADAIFSLWKPNSPMSRLRREEIVLEEAPREVAEVLERCELAKATSGGWFDPWAMPGGLDPTGLVKGWAAERALDALVAAGIDGAMVNAGGDVATSGQPEEGTGWRIGIRDPSTADRLVAVVSGARAVATSGVYERGQHLVDPHDQMSRVRVASATVTGPELDLADAYATAVAVAGVSSLEWVDALEGYEALVVGTDGFLRATPRFPLAPNDGDVSVGEPNPKGNATASAGTPFSGLRELHWKFD